MKQLTDTRQAAVTNVENRRAFTIQASGKAFRTLIDGIYSNKILAPVRELMTNAFDGHLAAGNTDVPFDVHVPNHDEPVFRVRDYGVGMDHDTVMNLYTTLFSSSKDESNDQVGMLGLGSKSPFAYTDSFTVTCYDGTSKRVYSAHMDDDIPQLGLLYEEDTTEPRGVSVQFPVDEPRDYQTFSEAVQRVLLGFDVQPNLTGLEVEPREITEEGDGYKVVRRIGHYSEYLSPVNVRMGCVVYPVETLTGTTWTGVQMPDLARYIIDVPIGTTNITTNREALADDPQSVANLRPYLNAAFDKHKAVLLERYAQATTRLERCSILAGIDYEWRRAFDLPLQLNVSMLDDGLTAAEANALGSAKTPGLFVTDARKPKEIRYEFNYLHRSRFSFILDEEGVTRNRGRIRLAMDNGEYAEDDTWVVPVNNQKEAVKRLKTLCGFEDHQFVKVSDLTDPGPASKKAGSQASKSFLKDELDSGKPWVNRMRGKVHSSSRYHGENFRSAFITTALGVDAETIQEAGLFTMDERQKEWDKIVVPLSNAQVKALQPDPEMEVSKVIKRYWESTGHEDIVKEKVFVGTLKQRLNDKLIDSSYRMDLAEKILVAEGIDLDLSLDTDVSAGLSFVWGTNRVADLIVHRAWRNPSPAEEHFAPDLDVIDEAIEALRHKYPALFSMSDDDMVEYIKEVNAS